jgi:hydroxymethylpyrimidine/phosphomethylpyrimidine kinase
LPGSFHGSGCTLASALAAQLALGRQMTDALELAQAYCQQTLQSAYAIAPGQSIPDRNASYLKGRA